VRIDAAVTDRPINGLSPRLDVIRADRSRSDPPLASVTIPQTAPGRYELSVPAPARPAFAAVHLDGRLIDRIAVAGRYAPEFDAIGNDHAALRELARATGGAVIEPGQSTPIDFHWPVQRTPLVTPCCVVGALLIGAGLLRWRKS
jgi:hypothetical protein